MVTIMITEVSCWPECIDPDDRDRFTVKISYRGEGPDGPRYAVLRGCEVLTWDGRWEYEPRPSERTVGFIARTRFDYDAALRLAQATVPLLRVNGHTAAEWVAR